MKPSVPKGTRDFSPIEMVRRNFIFDSIRSVFQLYGYLPIETPALENLETLTGKSGEEADQLLFRILNSRLHESKTKEKSKEDFERMLEQNVNSSYLTEKALRYDLTVPFARYVVQHQNEIAFPFKRYQMQPVWRADRPQKGRYREFYQCDADVIGSDSLLNEVELIQLMDDVFTKLDIPVTIKMNNRKVLMGIAEVVGEQDKIVDITVAIDKLDKIGVEGVNKELKEKNISDKAIEQLQPLINFVGSNNEKLELLKQILSSSESGRKGIEELEYIFSSQISNLKSQIELDITLARGLNYYTGAIFEVKANEGTLTSSITGGGRYDNLTGIFGLPNVSGVGISFGIDRIFDVMNELSLFEKIDYTKSTTKVMFVNFGPAEEKYCLPLLSQLRKEGINSEIYPDHAKIKKQFDYANKKQIPFVIVVGSDEMQSGALTLKDMTKGTQEKLPIGNIIATVK